MSDMPTADQRSPGAIAALSGLSAVADRYDTLFCDIWGVLHDGLRENAPAGEALERFRAQGGTVVLVTNAPIPQAAVARLLDKKQVRRQAWDAIVSSGDVTRSLLVERGGGGVFHIGPDRDLSLFADLPTARAPMETASVAVVTGLVREETESAEDYLPQLQQMRARYLDLVCANPDRVVHVGDRLLPCAGAIGDLYEELGGVVLWAGKPHAPIYDMALAKARALRGADIDKARILMIGDSVRTDLAGATAYGLDALFVSRGIHRDGADDNEAAALMLREAGADAIGVTPFLRW
ncbi:MAG: TIGR01459 family HAD-type hydrolase [Rhizobiales bacterium]|nr:TIGR01459 family HAD-type hydrolase [Hyphomicrobiales bacterium]